MSIYKRKSGRYAVVVAKSEGSAERKSLGTFATRKEAERAERDALQARDRGYSIAPKKITIAELMAEFIEYCRANPERHTTATIETYTLKSKRYIEPKLGSIVLSKLQPATVAAWQSDLRATIGRRGDPLSAKTVHNIFGILHAALSLAVGLEYVGRNVCDIKAARPARLGTSAHVGRVLTADEVQRLLNGAESTRWHSFVLVALATGARRGELCGLSWDDIDFEKLTIRIRHSLSQTKNCLELKDTKTHREREVPTSQWAADALRRQCVMQAEDQLRAPFGMYIDSGAVFTNEIGERITPMAATKAYGRIAKSSGISTRRLHDTRHTAASRMLAAGIDPVTVAYILGHESANITLRVYGHKLSSNVREAIDRLGDIMSQIASGELNDSSSPKGSATVLQPSDPGRPESPRQNVQNMVEARRLELLTLTLPA